MRPRQSIYKTPSAWNNIKNKPIVTSVAEPCDIVMKINHIWFLLQHKNDINNVVAFKDPKSKPIPVKKVIASMFDFVYRLATEYNIDAIKLKGRKNKYNFVSRLFPDVCVLAPYLEDGYEVRFIKINDTSELEKLNRLRKQY